jgi:hypothetical protein
MGVRFLGIVCLSVGELILSFLVLRSSPIRDKEWRCVRRMWMLTFLRGTTVGEVYRKVMGDAPLAYVETVGGVRVSDDDVVGVGKNDVSPFALLLSTLLDSQKVLLLIALRIDIEF